MNNVVKKNLNNIIVLFILLGPIIDLLTGLSINLLDSFITPGILFRLLFLLVIVIINLFVYKNKKVYIPYILIGIYMILYALGIIIYKDGVGLIYEIQNLIKIFYFPLVFISLYYLKEEFKISKLTLLTTMFIYILLIFFPTILGIGFKTYQITKAGTLGFYNSANEISGIISILTPIMFICFKDLKNPILKTILTLIYLIVILMIGTKTPLLTLIIVSLLTLFYLWYKSIKSKNYKPILTSFILLIGMVFILILIIPKTNFYKNIDTHLNYLKLDNVTEVFEDEELVDHFIFSQRLTFLDKKITMYKEASIYQKLFGIGYLNKNKPSKMIEMDYFDIYFAHGLIGFLIYFIPLIVIIGKVVKPKKFNYDNYMLNISFFLIVFLALFTGHIITSPAVSIISIMIILMLIPRKKKRLVFMSNDMKLGGIESALVNLLNYINYDKYNVTLVLEKKEGINLKNINEKVLIKELRVSNCRIIFFRKLINFIRKFNYKIINFNNYDFSCCYATYSLSSNKLAKISSKNNSLYVHSNYTQIYDTKEEVLDFFNKRGVSSYKRVLFVSNEAKNDFIKLYPDLKNKVKVFNNFINTNKVKMLSKELIEIKKPTDKKLLVFVGRLDEPSKRLSRAINLVKELKNIELWIIGDGVDKEKYIEQVNSLKVTSRVKFLGLKPNPYPYMNISDYVILTSDYEGFPVVYLEAITLDKEIITTIKTSDEEIDIKDYAYIISKDQEEMIKEVKEILKKDKKHKKYNLEDIQAKRIKSLEKVFNEVI